MYEKTCFEILFWEKWSQPLLSLGRWKFELVRFANAIILRICILMKLSLWLKDLTVNQIMNKIEEMIMYWICNLESMIYWISRFWANVIITWEDRKIIRCLERWWFMLALIRENLVFSWWYHWGKYDEIRKENTWDNSRGWVDLFMEFDPKVIYSFGMFMIILIVANIYYILWWLYGYSWIEFVIENKFRWSCWKV